MFLPIAMATNLKSAIFIDLIVARNVWVAAMRERGTGV